MVGIYHEPTEAKTLELLEILGLLEENDLEMASRSHLLLQSQDPIQAYSLLIAHILNSPEMHVLIPIVVDQIVADSQANYVDKLQILDVMFACFPAQVLVLKAIIAVSVHNDDMELVQSSLKSLNVANVDESSLKELYLLLSESFKSSPITGYNYALKYLFLCNDHVDDAAKSVASKTIVKALSIPEVCNFEDIYNLQAVKATESAVMHDLLKIFQTGTIVEYKSFVKKHPNFLKKHALNEDDLLFKIRVLTLQSLASNSINQDIKWELIAQELQVPIDQVELWILNALRAGVLNAKIDQEQESVRIIHAQFRVFTANEWIKLKELVIQVRGQLKQNSIQ